MAPIKWQNLFRCLGMPPVHDVGSSKPNKGYFVYDGRPWPRAHRPVNSKSDFKAAAWSQPCCAASPFAECSPDGLGAIAEAAHAGPPSAVY